MSQKPYNHSPASLKSSTDFGTANKAAALLRKILLGHTKEFWDATFYKRLKETAVTILNTCSPSRKGSLQFTEGNLHHLTRLEFNPLKALWMFGFHPIDIRLEKTDFLIIKLPAIDPKEHIKYPYSATSMVVRLVCGIIHFDLEKGGTTALNDLEIPLDKPFPGAQVKIPLEAAETSVVCVTMCIYFKKGIDKLNHPENKCHAGSIIRVYNIVDGEVKNYQRPADLPVKPAPPERPKGLDWEINEE